MVNMGQARVGYVFGNLKEFMLATRPIDRAKKGRRRT